MFARLDENNVVVELINYDSLEGRFHPDFVATCVECNEAVAVGKVYRDNVFVEPEADTNAMAVKVRADRDRHLSSCDWTQLPDAPLDETAKAAWAVYRQALRDVPQQAGFPEAVTWPEGPE